MSTRIATAAGAGPDIRIFVPFTKVEENADGSVYVEGVATAEVLDFHGEVVSYEASKAAFEEWSDWAQKATDGQSIGNIRVMHQPVVAGRAVKWWADDATRSIHLGATIDDPAHAKLCRSRAYTGYSIGGNDVAREMGTWDGKAVPWITRYRLSENSLVDKPACPTATFTLVKRAFKEITAMKPIEFLKANLSAVLLYAAAMPEKDTLKLGDETISIAGTPELPVLELRKDAASAVVAGAEALAALKKFMVEVLGMDGDPDLWTIGDICEAMRYCYSARMGAQYAASESGVESAAGAELRKSETPAPEPVADPPTNQDPADKPKDDDVDLPAPVEDVPPSPSAEAIENAVKAQLAPVIEKLEKAIVASTPVAATSESVSKGDLDKIAKAEDVAELRKDVAAIKSLLEKLPAPPPGRAINKSIGALNGGDQELTPESMEKAVELLEASGRLEHADRVKLRTALATATIQLGQQR
jgi:hypothetical protein